LSAPFKTIEPSRCSRARRRRQRVQKIYGGANEIMKDLIARKL